MTNLSEREWIRRTTAHQETGAVPYNFMFSPAAERLAKAQYGEDLENALTLPIRMSGPASIKPLYAQPDQFGDRAVDEFGVIWSTSSSDRGSPIGPCLKEASLTGYTFPVAANEARFRELPGWCRSQASHYRILWVGDLIDLGLDILHPIQPEAMDPALLKREFGRHLTFCGGFPTQNLLVSATPDEVRAEVRRLKRVMGEGGGFILEPGITIQVDVPSNNLIAMIDEARLA